MTKLYTLHYPMPKNGPIGQTIEVGAECTFGDPCAAPFHDALSELMKKDEFPNHGVIDGYRYFLIATYADGVYGNVFTDTATLAVWSPVECWENEKSFEIFACRVFKRAKVYWYCGLPYNPETKKHVPFEDCKDENRYEMRKRTFCVQCKSKTATKCEFCEPLLDNDRKGTPEFFADLDKTIEENRKEIDGCPEMFEMEKELTQRLGVLNMSYCSDKHDLDSVAIEGETYLSTPIFWAESGKIQIHQVYSRKMENPTWLEVLKWVDDWCLVNKHYTESTFYEDICKSEVTKDGVQVWEIFFGS